MSFAPLWTMFEGVYSQRRTRLVFTGNEWMTQGDFMFYRWTMEKACA